MTLRVLTYLAPSIPLGLFELVVERLRRVLGVGATLRAEARHSGPPPDIPDPFSADEADHAFLCSPSFGWLSGMRPSPIELVPAAPVFLEPRTAGRPVYFSDVIVHPGVASASFEERNLLARLRALGEDRHFLRTARRSGSHLRAGGWTARRSTRTCSRCCGAATRCCASGCASSRPGGRMPFSRSWSAAGRPSPASC